MRPVDAGMSPRRRLAGFAALLVAVFGVSAAVGRAVPQVHDDVDRSHIDPGHQRVPETAE